MGPIYEFRQTFNFFFPPLNKSAISIDSLSFRNTGAPFKVQKKRVWITSSWRVTLHRGELRTICQYCGSTVRRIKAAFLCYLAEGIRPQWTSNKDRRTIRRLIFFYLRDLGLFTTNIFWQKTSTKGSVWMAVVLPSCSLSRRMLAARCVSMGDLNFIIYHCGARK